MKIIFRLIVESYSFAIKSLMSNKLQTMLSLLGITIGIFSVISVFTLVDSLKYKIESSVNKLGSNVLYVQKWPWSFSGDFPWWKYYQRPEPTIKDADGIRKRLKEAKSVAYMINLSETVKYEDKIIEDASVVASSIEYQDIFSFEINNGRYFSPIECYSGKPVVIIGSEIAKSLFEDENPIGKTIKIFGKNNVVIGVFEKQGEDALNQSHDKKILMPINLAKNEVNLNSGETSSMIAVLGKTGIATDQLKDEMRSVLRAVHRLRPIEEDDFSINEIDLLTTAFDGIFKSLSIAGWFIGGLSLLVGGFGIANIMFVTVKERTNQIGIQKALGAKNFVILFQFLFESVFLSIFGGILGLILVFIGVLLAKNSFGFELIMSFGNVFLGIMVSMAIGLLAGLIPAVIASRMSPVEAMRSV